MLTEAAYLLATYGGFHLVENLLRSCSTGFLEILSLDTDDAEAMAGFLNDFGDQQPDLADAALVHLAERESILHVFTVDVTDFSIYRTASGKRLVILPESWS